MTNPPLSHPDSWKVISSRPLIPKEVFEANAWLRAMAQGHYDIDAEGPPCRRLIVYFERDADSVWFKLAWGGPQ